MMPNEGNPRRRELIPPRGKSRDVKYVSWYLYRATMKGFTYRNRQWDGDSQQCPPDFTLRKDLTGTKSWTTEAAILALWNMKGMWDKRSISCLLEGNIHPLTLQCFWKQTDFYMLDFLRNVLEDFRDEGDNCFWWTAVQCLLQNDMSENVLRTSLNVYCYSHEV